MALNIKFSFICEKQFSELQGTSNEVRFCEKCQFQVTNLDPLSDEQRLALFEDAVNNNKKICVSTTIPVEDSLPCSRKKPSMPPPRQTAGLPAMPPPNMLALERERIEKLKAEQAKNQESKQGWLAKLKFW